MILFLHVYVIEQCTINNYSLVNVRPGDNPVISYAPLMNTAPEDQPQPGDPQLPHIAADECDAECCSAKQVSRPDYVIRCSTEIGRALHRVAGA